MDITQITRDSELKEFVNFPYELYKHHLKGESWWTPSMKAEVESALDPDEHPFYRDESSDARAFLAKNDGETLGRIMVLESGPYNRANEENSAFFYFFESTENQEVVDALFAASINWARSRGLGEIIGPMGMLAGDGHGILVDGFEQRPGTGIPWNPPYYGKLIENAGLRKLADSSSALVEIDFALREDKVNRLYGAAEKIKNSRDFSVISFESKSSVRERMDWLVPQLSNLYNESFQDLSFFHPMDRAKMRRILERLLRITDSSSVDLIKLALKGNKVIGFLLAYPNVVTGLRRAGGSLWPLGWLYLYLSRRFTRWVDANGVGVLPEYRGSGVSILLYTEFLRTLEESRYRHLVINQISEENHRNLREIQKTFGVEFDRKHRIYRIEV